MSKSTTTLYLIIYLLSFSTLLVKYLQNIRVFIYRYFECRDSGCRGFGCDSQNSFLHFNFSLKHIPEVKSASLACRLSPKYTKINQNRPHTKNQNKPPISTHLWPLYQAHSYPLAG